MTITVPYFEPDDNSAIVAAVEFNDEPGFLGFHARVIVRLDNHDRLISDLKAEAIQRAKDFLSHAVSSR